MEIWDSVYLCIKQCKANKLCYRKTSHIDLLPIPFKVLKQFDWQNSDEGSSHFLAPLDKPLFTVPKLSVRSGKVLTLLEDWRIPVWDANTGNLLMIVNKNTAMLNNFASDSFQSRHLRNFLRIVLYTFQITCIQKIEWSERGKFYPKKVIQIGGVKLYTQISHINFFI